MRRWLTRRPTPPPRPEAEVIRTISHVGRLVSAELELPKVVQGVTDAATQLTGAAFGAFFYNVVDPAGERYTLYTLSGVPRSAFEKFPMPRNTQLFAATFRGDGVVRLDDVTKDARYGKQAPHFGMPRGHLPVVSYLAVPVVARDGEVLGGLFFGHPEPARFTAAHEEIVVTLAGHAAIAMQNARRYEDAQRALDQAEAAERRAAFLADAGAVLGATLNVETVLQQMTELAVPRMGDWCAVFLRDHRDAIRCEAFVHQDAEKTDRGRAYIAARPVDIDAPHGVGKVIRTGLSEINTEITDEQLRAVSSDDEGVRMRKELGHGSVLVVPLRLGASVLGAVSLGRARPNAYDATDRVVAEDLAGRLALALQNARLYRDAQEARAKAERASWQSAFLAEASRILVSSNDYDATLDAMIRLAVPTLADWAVVHLARRDGLRRIGPAYADPSLAPLAEAVRRVAPPIPRGISTGTASAVRGGQSLLVREMTEAWLDEAIDDPAYREVVRRLDPRSVIMVPLVARGRTLGSLTLVSLHETRRYGQGDLEFAEEIGRRAGIAVDNIRLYRQAEQARAEAESANRAKDEFLAVLSHELRTPLNAIAGWVHMLGEGALQGAAAERAVATVRRNVTMLRRLIEDLLDVSAIIAGKLALETSPCELAPIVDQSVESAGADAATKQIALKSTLAPGVVVDADALRMRQIVGNLLSNALKFTPAGGEVRVELERAGDVARLVIVDTGAGIPRELLPHVFDRFRQADSSSTRRHGGLGLGLAIVKYLVERHGGTVRAENAPGGGACFTIELPIAT